jgi:hypothetical protein
MRILPVRAAHTVVTVVRGGGYEPAHVQGGRHAELVPRGGLPGATFVATAR